MRLITESILKKPREFFVQYLCVWLAIVGLHIGVMIFFYHAPWGGTLVDSLIFFLTYICLGIGIGFVVSYSSMEGSPIYKVVFIHTLCGIFLVSFWLQVCCMISAKLFYVAYSTMLRQGIAGRFLEGFLIYGMMTLYFYVIFYYTGLKEKIQKESDLIALVREAELKALKSQINPHFLFNSLNSISSLTMTDPEKAQEMVINLSTFLRYSLQHDKNAQVPLRTELDNVKLYLDIEKVRFGSKLNLLFEVEPECEKQLLPNMILQPLFENAIKYGVYETMDQVTIRTVCSEGKGFLNIEVSNDFDPKLIVRNGEGIGLKNIRNRLKLIYDSENLMVISATDCIFKVHLKIPQQVG